MNTLSTGLALPPGMSTVVVTAERRAAPLRLAIVLDRIDELLRA